jgi:hypothetical protein
MHEGITLRYGFPDDAAAIGRLAALDSAEIPSAPLLVAEVGGELRAALSLADGRVIADPFYPTLAVVALLRERGRQLTAIPAGRHLWALRWIPGAKVRTRRRLQPDR